MRANPNVDGYTKTLNHQNILEKRKKNYWKPKQY